MYHLDGSTMALGDLIWWNEGVCVGFIHVIIESPEEIKSWGLDEPGFLVGNMHPFDPSGGYVMYSPSDLEDEGIAKLSEGERDELDRATDLARQQSAVGFEGRSYAVSTCAENCEMVEWIFSLKQDDEEIERIVIPCRNEPSDQTSI